MSWYPNTIPDWLSNRFSSYHWHGDRKVKKVYLTFDDGPTPVVTNFVLEQLAQYRFKATFFLIGDRVTRHAGLKDTILNSGHRIGNHTFHHLNAWKTNTAVYMENIALCERSLATMNTEQSRSTKAQVNCSLFRPPYGRIKPSITKELRSLGYEIVLWDVLSGDFDPKRSASSCLSNLFRSTKNGSVIVFHDSKKAFPTLKQILPPYLKWLQNEGFEADVI